MYPQSVSFAELPVIGADVCLPRGPDPGTIRLRVPHDQDISAEPGDLVISSDGTVSFAGCIPDLATLRLENRPAARREYAVLLYDRRAAWARQSVSAKFNVRRRDNSIVPSTKKTVSEIADYVLGKVGESGGSTGPDAYPPAEWDSISATEALRSLSETLPVFVCRKSDDTYVVQQTGQGDSLPDATTNIYPDYKASLDAGPKTIEIECGKTWFQCGLELEAVGVDTSGEIKPIDDLSYKPSLGWEKEWPTLFTGVEQVYRPLALQSVFRMYRIKTPQSTAFGTIQSLDDIDVDPRRVVFSADTQPNGIVDGTYWPQSDHYENTTNCPIHSDVFWLDTESRVVLFHYPVWKAGNCVAPAELRLFTGFHLREDGEWIRERFTVDRTSGSGKETIRVDHLWRARAYYKDNCAEGDYHDNTSDLTAEAQVYLDAWKDHYDTIVDKRQKNYAGVWPISLSGNIQKITMRVGKGEAPVTRASEHFEHRPA